MCVAQDLSIDVYGRKADEEEDSAATGNVVRLEPALEWQCLHRVVMPK